MSTTNNHKRTKVTTSYIRWSIVILVLIASGILSCSFFKNKEVVAHKTSVQVAMKNEQAAMEKEQEPTEANSEISGKYYGLCTKNSVRTVKDFRSTVEKDPVLSNHFAGFNWQTAHLGKQDNEVWTYVTYRKGEIISRTSKPVKLPKGDVYITDGTRMVRTFCCNDYVAAPPPSKANLEPSERVDGPPRRIVEPSKNILSQNMLSQWPINELPPPVDKSLETFPISKTTYLSPGGSGSYNSFGIYSTETKSNNPVPVVPEPSTFILLIAGITAIAFLKSKGSFKN